MGKLWFDRADMRAIEEAAADPHVQKLARAVGELAEVCLDQQRELAELKRELAAVRREVGR